MISYVRSGKLFIVIVVVLHKCSWNAFIRVFIFQRIRISVFSWYFYPFSVLPAIRWVSFYFIPQISACDQQKICKNRLKISQTTMIKYFSLTLLIDLSKFKLISRNYSCYIFGFRKNKDKKKFESFLRS